MDTITGSIDSILTISSLCAGNYAVTITDPLGCSATGSTIISQSIGYTTNITGQNTLCPNECTGTINITATGGAMPYTFYWSTGDTAAGHSQGTILSNLCAGTYLVTVTDSIGCTMIDSSTIYEPTPITVSLISNNASCQGLCDGNATITAQGGGGNYTYYWNTTPPSTSASVTGLCAGTYSFVVTDANSCETTNELTITNKSSIELLITNTAICAGDLSSTVVAINGDPPYSYSWSNSQNSATATNLVAGNNYTVTVTDDKGCSQSGGILMGLPVCEIQIPNTFSPNEDGINDTWAIKNLATYIDCEVMVYNRWGDKVFKSNGYTNSWDGSSGSGALPSAVYYYVIKIGSLGKSFSGSVTLLR
jgi:gliding motility-associated-like protein